jgi:hypothetical protein
MAIASGILPPQYCEAVAFFPFFRHQVERVG